MPASPSLPLRHLCCAIGLGLAVLAPAAHAQTPTPAIQQSVDAVRKAPTVRQVLDDIKSDHARTVDELRTLVQIPAPPFKEQKRAEYFLSRLKALGLTDAYIDKEGNAIGVRKGTGQGPKLVVSAHLDTVFPEGTDVTVKERDGKLYAPGIADDTRGLSVLLSWIKALNERQLQTVGDIVFVGNVGEEELGNLRGMKAIFRDHTDIDGFVGLEPGVGNVVLNQGTGSHRFEVAFKGPGGHSFGAFGQVPSAIHAMGRAIAHIADVQVPTDPKTTFTVGKVGGGTSVNAIAGDASMAIDIRSNALPTLLQAEKDIMAAIQLGVEEENRRWNTPAKITVTSTLIGDRPAGTTALDQPMVQTAYAAIAAAGDKPSARAGSTDANVPMGLGIPAMILGSGGKNAGSHALGEWFDPTDAWQGAQTGLTTVLSLVGVQGVSQPVLARRTAR
ncbi:M20/M25/M40 family metallo-hydrolase [Xylophilus rhododendri]|uniref:M20/M25/M40 family metallo-hydrolase n=1 Tax=Xylophilus rhododendri TaxID=2697032 RepID=A0A857J4Y9_9BURK|nr:M20/M25/M40 family metallo-hydrolase [Xylophilus rhododendri]QHI98747.1 M20/M25/M40 family metallo-hydrolase [Xylophilus rhododendri]